MRNKKKASKSCKNSKARKKQRHECTRAYKASEHVKHVDTLGTQDTKVRDARNLVRSILLLLLSLLFCSISVMLQVSYGSNSQSRVMMSFVCKGFDQKFKNKKAMQCVSNVQIRRFFWLIFFRVRTVYLANLSRQFRYGK